MIHSLAIKTLFFNFIDDPRKRLSGEFQSLVRENPFCNLRQGMASASLFLPGFNRSFAKTPFATEAKACAEIAGISLFQSLVRENPFCNFSYGTSRHTHIMVSI